MANPWSIPATGWMVVVAAWWFSSSKSMSNPWSIQATGWMVVVAGWWFSPIISFYLQKAFACVIFDASKELLELEFHTIPALQATLIDVEEKRMIGAATYGAPQFDLEKLHKLDKRLKSALREAKDILYLVAYHRIEKEVTGDGSSSVLLLLLQTAIAYIVALCRWRWVSVQRLLHAAATCVACWTESMIQRFIDITPAPLQQFLGSLKHQLGRLFGAITSCCWSVLSWSMHILYWSYEQVGTESNQQKYGNMPITEGIRLRKIIKGIEHTLTSAKSDLLKHNNSSTTEEQCCTVTNSANERCSKQKEIDDSYRVIGQKVFGRDKDRAHISKMLREGPDTYIASPSTSKPYSVIGIYGITGSGKSTLAQYVFAYEKGAGHFNLIMFIIVGKTFSIHDIFRDMLDQIKQQLASDIKDPKSPKAELKDHESLKAKLKGLKSLKTELSENLEGKRFLLVLDDVWINDDNQREWYILFDTLNAALSGSRVLVTAQKKDAAEALGAQEQILIPDLEEKVYLSLFMHHAGQDASDDDGQYEWIGWKIANRLCRSPIAAVTVGKQLQRNKSISFWETTANMGALWWSYQQLGVEIRQCFAYCSIFPKGYELQRDNLVGMWIAQGFVNTWSNATEELEDVGQRNWKMWARGTLNIQDHGIVRSKKEALEFPLTHKEHLRNLDLIFGRDKRDPNVLEVICPSKALQELSMCDYKDSRYPNWLISHQHNGFEPLARHNKEVELDREALDHILSNASEEPIELSYAFLQNITDDFSQEIGSGGFGVVYMGDLQHKKIAVKKIFQKDFFSDKKFEDELKCLRRVKHKNIVRFLGYCSYTIQTPILHNGQHVIAEDRQRFLCFEYVPNKSLHEYLKDESRGHEWDIRYQLIIGICQGLCYLHNKERIIHLDLKPENILLDVDMVPKIADFGISRLFSAERSRIITEHTIGSRFYMAPEYWSKGEITFKCDIFSLGVILKKLLLGNNDFSNLENWHQSPDIDNPQLKRCIEVAQICVNEDPSKRPTIDCIINMLSEKNKL